MPSEFSPEVVLLRCSTKLSALTRLRERRRRMRNKFSLFSQREVQIKAINSTPPVWTWCSQRVGGGQDNHHRSHEQQNWREPLQQNVADGLCLLWGKQTQTVLFCWMEEKSRLGEFQLSSAQFLHHHRRHDIVLACNCDKWRWTMDDGRWNKHIQVVQHSPEMKWKSIEKKKKKCCYYCCHLLFSEFSYSNSLVKETMNRKQRNEWQIDLNWIPSRL